MMNSPNGGRPLSRKQTVRLMIALTILAWATQTLFKQWGFGAEIPAAAQPERTVELEEKFVPGNARFTAGATLEMRPEATITGEEVKLRQICRWADRDETIFAPMGDLVVVRLASRAPFKAITVNEIRGLLQGAGVNVAAINFAGPTTCTVARADVEYDQNTALQQWIDAKQEGQTPASEAPTTLPAESEDRPVKTLRTALVEDMATRLGLAVELLQVDFKSQDSKVLNISSPLFLYEIEPVRAKALGRVAWAVTIKATDAAARKVQIDATARAWQNQLVVAKPVGHRQVIRSDDLVARRALVDRMNEEPLLAMEQAVGQMASRELKPGAVLTGKMIDPLPLVKPGQFVTVTLDQGTVKIRSVAKALEGGSYGQTIRVKNEATKDVFQVVLTGPQAATMSLSGAPSGPVAPVASISSQE